MHNRMRVHPSLCSSTPTNCRTPPEFDPALIRNRLLGQGLKPLIKTAPEQAQPPTDQTKSKRVRWDWKTEMRQKRQERKWATRRRALEEEIGTGQQVINAQGDLLLDTEESWSTSEAAQAKEDARKAKA